MTVYVPNRVYETDTIRTMMNKLNEAMDTIPQYADMKVADLIDSAPETLDTLRELSDALGNDANFSTTIMEMLAIKAEAEDLEQLRLDSAYYTDTEIGKQQVWLRKESFVSSEGQDVFVVKDTYDVGKDRVSLSVGGVSQ